MSLLNEIGTEEFGSSRISGLTKCFTKSKVCAFADVVCCSHFFVTKVKLLFSYFPFSFDLSSNFAQMENEEEGGTCVRIFNDKTFFREVP